MNEVKVPSCIMRIAEACGKFEKMTGELPNQLLMSNYCHEELGRELEGLLGGQLSPVTILYGMTIVPESKAGLAFYVRRV